MEEEDLENIIRHRQINESSEGKGESVNEGRLRDDDGSIREKSVKSLKDEWMRLDEWYSRRHT